MQIKRFEAQNMTAALRLIKAELGADAVILSARSIKKRSGIWGALKNSGVEVTAATDTRINTGDDSSGLHRTDGVEKPLDPFLRRPENLIKRGLYGQGDGVAGSGGVPRKRSGGTAPGKKYLIGLYQQLISQGVDADIAADLTEGIKLIPNATRRLAGGESEILLSGLLETMGLRAEAIQFDKSGSQAIAFIGTTGVGKTTTIAKLAALYAVAGKKSVALITFDDVRIGALEQIRVYAKIIGVPLAVASNRSDLKGHLKRFKNMDLVLIDTPGLNSKNNAQIEELQSCFEKLPAMQTQLVLSATTKEADLIDTIKRLKGFGQRRLLFTRLDETGAVGNLLNVLIRTNVPISYVSDGQQIPDDIRPASLDNLFRILLHEKTASYLHSEFVPISEAAKRVDKPADSGKALPRSYFVANRNSEVYHIAGCKWTNKIKHEHMITFESAAAAAHQNYLPCRNCNPDRDMQTKKITLEGDHHIKVNASAY